MTEAAHHVHQPASTHIATLFGIGRIRFAPGTFASLAAYPVGWWLGLLTGAPGVIFGALVAFAVGWYACSAHARRTGVKDPKECVMDELAGQWLALAAIPIVDGFFHWIPLVAAFVGFRFFDIIKPWPISRAERFDGGLGIMADDMIAGGTTALLIVLAWWLKAFA